jgi:hypothetical protein
MPIDVLKETIVSLNSGRKLLPRAPSFRKLKRWINVGVRSWNGKLVKLETIKIGGEPCTSLEAFDRFCQKLSELPVDRAWPR